MLTVWNIQKPQYLLRFHSLLSHTRRTMHHQRDTDPLGQLVPAYVPLAVLETSPIGPVDARSASKTLVDRGPSLENARLRMFAILEAQPMEITIPYGIYDLESLLWVACPFPRWPMPCAGIKVAVHLSPGPFPHQLW